MKIFFKIILVFCAGATMHSCYTPRYVYSPASTNAPLFKEKGDSKIGINIVGNGNSDIESGSSRAGGIDVKGAYSLSNHFFVHGMYSARKEDNIPGGIRDLEDELYYKRNYSELGLGYYKGLTERKIIFFQLSAGVGTAKNKIKDLSFDTLGPTQFNSNFIKFYVQPNFQFYITKSFALSFNTRFETLKFSDIQTGYDVISMSNFKLNGLDQKNLSYFSNSLLLDYQIRSLRDLNLNMEFGYTVALDGFTRYFAHRGSLFSIGASADIKKLFRKN